MDGIRRPALGSAPGRSLRSLLRLPTSFRPPSLGVLSLLLLLAARDGSAQGLLGEYFDEKDLTGFVEARVDGPIDFTTWGAAPSGTSVVPDNVYSQRYTGRVRIDTAGAWTFKTLSNDGVRLWIGEQLVIDNWTQHAATFDSGTRTLSAGLHDLRLEHYQDAGAVVLQLFFSGPGQSEVLIPSSHLSLATQHGLRGEYYDDIALTELVETRVDEKVDFTNWGSAPTGTSVAPDGHYGERWTGTVLADEPGTWTFATESNDGVRLRVGGQLLIDNWTQHASTLDTATITLTEGWHGIELEHFQQGGSVVIRLLHAGPGESLQVIPTSHLSVTPEVTAPLPVVSAGPDVVLSSPQSSIVLPGSADVPDGGPLQIAWVQLDGWPAFITNGDTSTPTVSGLHAVGSATFRLVATNVQGKSTFDDVTVRVEAPGDGPAVISGNVSTYHRVTLDFPGPTVSETGSPNPFRNYKMDVTFRHLDSNTVRTVPGFFAADGQAHETGATAGNVWRARFTPEAPGTWTYSASFRQGTDVALSLDPSAGTPTSFHGATGTLSVQNSFLAGPGLRRDGHLQWVDRHHLRFHGSGRRFLKGGADSPENLLAYADFDQTTASHAYGPHAGDWTLADPVWQGGKGKALVGASNYLAGKGMNAVYFITFTVDGDGDDVWPWTSKSERQRFDVSKLEQWETVFEHMQDKGLVLQFVLQETENDDGPTSLDDGTFGLERKLYIRELVARFGHHVGLVWNLGEESTNGTTLLKAQYDRLVALDAYAHPVVVHTFPNDKNKVWDPLLDDARLEGAPLQNGSISTTHQETLNWRNKSSIADRRWPVSLDEHGPAERGALPDAFDFWHDAERKSGLWGNLMAGGSGVEWYFGYDFPHDDLNCEDWRSRDHLWELTRHGLDFFENHLPFADMEPHDALVTGSNNWCLAKPGVVYAAYLPSGGSAQIDLGTSTDTFAVRWFDPRSGGDLQVGSVTSVSGPGWKSLGSPPSASGQDWAVRVRRTNVAPAVVGTGFLPQFVSGTKTLHLWALVDDADGPADVRAVLMHVFLPGGLYVGAFPTTPSLALEGLHVLSLPWMPSLGAPWFAVAQVIDREGASSLQWLPLPD